MPFEHTGLGYGARGITRVSSGLISGVNVQSRHRWIGLIARAESPFSAQGGGYLANLLPMTFISYSFLNSHMIIQTKSVLIHRFFSIFELEPKHSE